MFELKQIKELMAAMSRYETKRIEIRKEGTELVIERETPDPQHIIHAPPPPEFSTHHRHVSSFPPASEFSTPTHPSSKESEKEQKPGVVVPSPMVGTFYSSPAPDAPPFVKVGDRVSSDTVVCIIEAMKVMNEVKAGVEGIIAEECVRSGDPVEFGTALFRIQNT